MKASDCTWLAIGGLVVAHNVAVARRGGEQLSQAVDRYQSARPVVTNAVIALTAAHLANRLPVWADPWVWVFALLKWRAPTR